MKNSKFSFRKRMASFRYAFSGLGTLIREEHNAWIHIFCAILAVFMGRYFNISNTEWIAIIFAIAMVISMELVNSAIENLCDAFSTEKNAQIKKVKDLSAAGVLISAIAALIIGLIIFTPKIISLCESY